jgi:hypothetical protein
VTDAVPTVALVGPSDSRWTRALANVPHDVYELPEYVAFAARAQEPGEPLAGIVERGDDRLLVPLIVRVIPADLGGDGRRADAVSPRGYPGPVVSVASGPSDGFLEAALPALWEALLVRGVVSAFIRLHPLFDLPLDALSTHGDLVDHGDSVSIDLSLSEEELWRQTRNNHRRDINAAVRAGFVARIDERWERFEDFVAAFGQSMERLDSAPWWRLDATYFRGLREALGERLRLCVVEDGERVAAGALLTEVDGIVEYHLSGTFDSYITASPTKLIIHFATRWAKARGDRVLHLAGSLRQDDSLIRFKLGFSPMTHPVRTWRVVIDRPAYDELSAARLERHGLAAGSSDGFFPAYRQSAPAADAAVAPDPERS